MGRSLKGKKVIKQKRAVTAKPRAAIPQPQVEIAELNLQEKYFTFSSIAILFGFGIYYSVLYFGHRVMPSPDFPSFLEVGRQLWSFKIPTNFMRGPVLGLLVYPLSFLVGGQHPELTAAWLLNAILQPCNLILLFLVGKRVVGRPALWLALLVILNPWLIEVFTKPIAEICLLLTILLTFYFMFRGSYWCYLFASIATMTRYESAALILAAFVMDMIYRKSKREKVYAFCYSVLASIPLGFWMLGTVLTWPSEGGSTIHYLRFINIEKLKDVANVRRELNLLWSVAFGPLFRLGPGAGENAAQTLANASKLLACVSFGFGVFYGLVKKQWNILALLIFFVPYMLVHISYSFSDARFYTPVCWILLLICWYGIQSCWLLINANNRIPKPVIVAAQVLVLVVGFVWLSTLVGYLPGLSDVSKRSVSLPYVAVSASVLIIAAGALIYKGKHLWRNVVILMVFCLVIVSNQFSVAGVVRDGQRDAEFKQLLDWYLQNAKPGEKMLSTLSGLLGILTPAHKDFFIPTGNIKADSPEDFVNRCYATGITYVAWDSRIGLFPDDVFYKLMKLENIDMLRRPQSVGPYEYITTIFHKTEKWRYINVFRLRAPPAHSAENHPDAAMPEQDLVSRSLFAAA
jgi:hypothetical protein